MAAHGTSKTTRLRKVSCHSCGYVIRVTRSWMAEGLPSCPWGAGEMTADDPADLVELGAISLDDLPRPVRTEICRRMGWEDCIVRTSPSQSPGYRKPIRVRSIVEPTPF